ncbi:hypothetical protein [Streptomyces sp. NPDC057238]|uniref:hypothetical protein n=1 Tax=Streptomyces sp. NPDC057238 TaxID=3346060 RepID=UPI0036270E99
MTTTLLAPLCRHAPERGHRCQPYRGFDDGNGWYHDGLMADPEFLPHPGLGGWNDVLLRACRGQGEQDRDWVQQQIPPEPTHRRHRRREEPRVHVWEYLTRTSRHNGGMRAISATFRMTEPTDAQAVE